MKAGDKLYCIKNYSGFEEGKYYSIDHCGDEHDCAVSVTYYSSDLTSHIYFSKFHNRTCEHRKLSEDEWELDRCQLRLDYLDKFSEEEKEEEQYKESIVTSCIGSAVCLYDYFITVPEVRQQKLLKISK